MFIEARSLVSHVIVEGPKAAPAVLLLHSLGTTAHVWDAQAEALSRNFRVVRPDLRGHGLTEVTSGPYTIEMFAKDAFALLDALDIRKAHIAGVSFGGLVAQAMAHQAPERVRSLVLCSTAPAFPPAQLWRDRAELVRAQGIAPIFEAVTGRWITPEGATSPAARGLRMMLLRTSREGYASAAEALGEADFTERTQSLRLPALVLTGERDVVVTPTMAESLRDAIEGAKLEIIEKAAHMTTVERPEAVTAAMLRFLQPSTEGVDEAGRRVRTEVLGEAHVARAAQATTDLDRDFQEFLTRTAWGSVWARPHFDLRMRSIVTLALTSALGCDDEFALHVKACRNTGATEDDLRELLLHVAAYAGIPRANRAMRLAKEALKKDDAPKKKDDEK
jgi:3-oxoadipate enol-lactonase / 4-carboxymuconolactone decarboxylase